MHLKECRIAGPLFRIPFCLLGTPVLRQSLEIISNRFNQPNALHQGNVAFLLSQILSVATEKLSGGTWVVLKIVTTLLVNG
jgi:hypothetical protein